MNIKVSFLNSLLHESNAFNIENKDFLDKIGTNIGCNIEVSDIKDYDCDLKLIFIASGGSEGLFLENMKYLKEPYYLLSTNANNSLASSLEILTYLNNNNLKGEILHGSVEYISSRIKELVETNYDNLGVIGVPSDWLIASIPDYKKVKDIYHVNLIDIDLEEVVSIYKDNLLSIMSELDKANLFYESLMKIVNKYNLKGLTIRCFDLLDDIKMTGCLALSKLNGDGIIGTCEGDIMSMLSMYLVKKHFNKSSFQANPSEINLEKDEIVLAHCTVPLDMVTSFKYDTHFESKIGVAIKGELAEGDCTVFRLSKNLKDYFVSNAKIIKNLNRNDLCRTQVVLKMDGLYRLLINPMGNHHIIFYGKHEEDIKNIMKGLLK